MLLINLGYMLLSKILTNIQRNINSGISGGDSYHSHSKAVKKVALLTGIYSCLCYVTLFLHYYLDLQTLSLTYVFMFVATILFIVGTFIESKYPYNEFTIVKRKRIDKEIETCIKEEGLNPIN